MEKTVKKVAIVGQFGVAKTSLHRLLVKSIFNEEYISTIGFNIDEKTTEGDRETLKVIIWDIAGESSITVVGPGYPKGTQGLFYVSDITRRETFLNLDQNVADVRLDVGDQIPIKILSNKVDPLDSESLECKKEKIPIQDRITSSAKIGENVENTFLKSAKSMLR